MNSNDINMEFSGHFGGKQVQFLDVQVELREDGMLTKGFRKPMATNAFLHYDSYHPSHVKKSLPYGQFLCLRINKY